MGLVKTEETQDVRNNFTSVSDESSVCIVLKLDDIVKAFVLQIRDDEKSLQANFKEQADLRASVIRFRNLERESQQAEARVVRAAALLPEDKRKEWKPDSTYAGKAIAITAPETVPLWQLIVAILEQMPTLQLVEIQDVLKFCGRDVTRQAIYSALQTHENTFEIKTRGRERFVSLKR